VSSVLARAAEAATRDVELQLAAQEQREVELTAAERWARDPVGWINAHVWIASRFANDGAELPGRKLRARSGCGCSPTRSRRSRRGSTCRTCAKTGELDLPQRRDREEPADRRDVAVRRRRLLGAAPPPVTGLAMHTKGGKIDDGGERNTVESLFGRIRYIDRRLDRHGCRTSAKLRYRPFSRDPAKVENPTNGASSSARARPTTPAAARRSTSSSATSSRSSSTARRCTRARRGVPGRQGAVLDGQRRLNEHARICDEKPLGWTYLRLHWSTHPSTRGPARRRRRPRLRAVRRQPRRRRVERPRPARAPLPRQADVAVVRQARHRQDARAGRERARHRP
jgi:hypothetical protein